MATRFLHVILALEHLAKSNIDDKSKAFFFLGNVYPDLIQDKRISHFERKVFFIPTYDLTKINKMITASNKKAERFFYLGWKSHLVIDKIWRDSVICSRLFIALWWYIYLNVEVKHHYYHELSYIDTIIRDKMGSQEITDTKKKVMQYLEYKNFVPITKNEVYDEFINGFLADLQKKEVEPYIRMVDQQVFDKFYKEAGQRISELLILCE